MYYGRVSEPHYPDVLRAPGAEERKDTGQLWAICEAKDTGGMAFLSSTLHSLGIFEKISGIKGVLKKRLLDLTQRQDQAGRQQRKPPRPHTSETALRCSPISSIPQTPLVLSPLPSTSIPPVLPQSSPLLFSSTLALFLRIPLSSVFHVPTTRIPQSLILSKSQSLRLERWPSG